MDERTKELLEKLEDILIEIVNDNDCCQALSYEGNNHAEELQSELTSLRESNYLQHE